jgi:A/G-specific adenine glycosylase
LNALAAASEEQVLKQWQGLGYYSRARNLHKSAKTIVTKHQGKFPQNYSDILALKGIGPYTAAAIASIAFNLPHPVLDGNVYRFLARYFGITAPTDSASGKKKFLKLLKRSCLQSNPGFHNEALMEFGALQCIPDHPIA